MATETVVEVASPHGGDGVAGRASVGGPPVDEAEVAVRVAMRSLSTTMRAASIELAHLVVQSRRHRSWQGCGRLRVESVPPAAR